jgi:hypothetical protein
MRPVPAVVALFMLAAASAAWAQRHDPPYEPSRPTIAATPLALAIAGFDRDGDLLVSRSEFDAQVKSSFAAGDRNGDGFIGLIEYSAWAEVTLGNANALPGPFNFDANGDDRISAAEFAAEFARRFIAMDTNNDARLSRAELVTLIANPMGVWRDRKRHTPDSEPGQDRPPN